MKIAINTFPLNSEHKGRGIGQYTDLLVKSLKEYDSKNTYIEFVDHLNEKVDVVHYPFFDIFQPTLKLYSQSKNIVTVHDLIPLKYPSKFPSGIRGKVNWWLQKKSLKKIDAIITDSRASADDIINITGVPTNKVHVISLAVPKEYKKLTPKQLAEIDLNKYNLPSNFILYVGDVNWNKNIPGLLKSFAQLIKENKFSDFKLVLVGSSFIKKELIEVQEVDRIIDLENIGNQVKKVGYVPLNDLVGIFNLAKLYVQPSFDEGFGLSSLEAMSCGTLVASARRGSLPEVIGRAGEYFDPNSEENMVDVLKKVLSYSDSEKKEKINESLHQATRFTFQKFAEKTINVYENVASDSSV